MKEKCFLLADKINIKDRELYYNIVNYLFVYYFIIQFRPKF